MEDLECGCSQMDIPLNFGLKGVLKAYCDEHWVKHFYPAGWGGAAEESAVLQDT